MGDTKMKSETTKRQGREFLGTLNAGSVNGRIVQQVTVLPGNRDELIITFGLEGGGVAKVSLGRKCVRAIRSIVK